VFCKTIGRGLLALAAAMVFLFGVHAPAFGEAVFWTKAADPNIYSTQLDGTGSQIFKTPGGGQGPAGVAVDMISGYLYWGSLTTGTIAKTKLDGTGSIDLVVDTGSSQPSGIALDLIGGHVFWTDRFQGTVQRANLDGSDVRTILTGLGEPLGICVDLAHNGLLWTESTTGKIGASRLDGTSPGYFLSGLNGPLGIAIDDVGQSLYWIESGKIRHHTAASGVQDVLTGLGGAFGLEIDQEDRTMYWSSQSGIYRADLDGTNVAILAGVQAGYIALAVPEFLLGDANKSGKVDVADLTLLLNNYKKSGKTWADGDFTGDGTVNIADLTALLNNYNKSIGASVVAGTAVPEPSSIAMLAGLALAALLYWRGNRAYT
jgi:hypothetical protein